jgi:hypothetical protein
MNNKVHSYLNDAGEEFSLSREERERMRQTIHAYMEMKPLRRSAAPERATLGFGWIVSPRPVAFALVAVLFVSSAGLSYAAEGALPGDLLYGIKTHVNEPLSGALALSTSAKTQWAMDVAGERVKEAATLAAEGHLSTTTQDALKANFDEHAAQVADVINETASTSPDTSDAIAVRFEAQLDEYADVLAQVGAEKNIPTDTIASSVATEKEHVIAIRANAHAHIPATIAARTHALSSIRTAAQEGLNSSAELARLSSGSISTSSAQLVAVQLQSASDTILSGDDFVGKDAAPDAINQFQNALAATEKIGVFLQTSSAIHARTGLVIGEPGTTTTTTTRSALTAYTGRGGDKKGGMESQPKLMAAFSSASTATLQVSATTTATTTANQNNEQNAVNAGDQSSSGSQEGDQGPVPHGPPILPLSVPLHFGN